MKLKLITIPVAVGLALASLAACGSGGGTSSGGASVASNAQDINAKSRDQLTQGGEVRLEIGSMADNWNAMNAAGNESDYRHVREPISARFFDYDASGDAVWNKDWLAKEPTVTNDGKTVVTYDVNPKATWNDGSKFTLADFTATWKACNGEDEAFQCATTEGYDQIESITQGTNDDQFIVTYKSTYPDWTSTFATGPARAESVATSDVFNDGWADLSAHPGWWSGPFKVGTIDATAQIITLVPNEKWWGAKPLLDKVIFRVVAPEAIAQAYQNNEIDAFDIGVNADFYAKAQAVSGGSIRRAAGPNWRHITVNQRSGLFMDKTIRQAFVLGMDRAQIAASDLAGLDWDPGVLSSNVFLTNQSEYVDLAKKTGIDYNVDKAKKLLDDAGWVVGSDGYRAKDGKTLEVKFTTLTGVKVSENEGQQVQDQLKNIGMKVTLDPVASKDFSKTLTSGAFESIGFTWVGTQYPFPSLNQFYNSKSDSNYSGFNNPEVEKAFAQIATEMDHQKRTDLANETNAKIWEDVNTISLYQRPDNWAVKATLANYGAFGLSTVQWENVGFVKS